jgi:carbonic anhydrase
MLPTTLIISLSLLSLTLGYNFNQQTCQATFAPQSPININSLQTHYLEEKMFRIIDNKYNVDKNTTWNIFPAERALGLKSSKENLGSIVLVKDWGMYNFILDKILFRVGVEHSIDGVKYDAEMQLIHTYDANYYTPGKRIHLGINYFVISVFFKKTQDDDPLASELFRYTNLEGIAKSTNSTMLKDIKLHEIIQHQPAYMYEGTLTYPDCQKALWYVNSQYHLIRQRDYDNLVAVTKMSTGFDSVTQNVRDQFVGNYMVYRNFNDITKFVPRVTMMNYSGAEIVSRNFILMMIVMIALFI